MITYNVTVKVQLAINEDWLKWMKEEHLIDMMETGCFTSYRLCRLLEQEENDGITYSIQYFAKNDEHYKTYLNQHAPALRDKSYKRFGDGFIAFRTLMEEIITGEK